MNERNEERRTPVKSTNRRARLVIFATAVACLGLALIDIVVPYVGEVLHLDLGLPGSLLRVFLNNAPFWIMVALLVPPAVWLCRRLGLDEPGWQWRVPIHLFAAMAFSALVLVGSRFMLYLARRDPPFWSQRLLIAGVEYFAVLFAIYWLIVTAFYAYKYYHEYQAVELQASRLRESLATAQLRALRAQLNPHFLFNTLQTVSALAMHGQNDTIIETLGRLGQLLRKALEGQAQEVPLQKELGLLEDYLRIECLRFSDRLTFDIDVEPEVHETVVPSMVLQPLVENAVLHGISAISGPGRITVRAYRKAEKLHLRVQDTGPGFNFDGSKEGVGLSNTRARLAQLYGDEYSLEIGNLMPHGTTVHITIPFQSTPRLYENYGNAHGHQDRHR